MLRRTLLRPLGAQGRKSFDAAAGNTKAFKTSFDSTFGVPEDRRREFEDIQVGMYKQKIDADRKQAAEFLKLPKEEQIRQFMLQKGKFDVDLVRKNGMDVKKEFDSFKLEHRKMQRKGSRTFWIPVIFATCTVIGAPIYGLMSFY